MAAQNMTVQSHPALLMHAEVHRIITIRVRPRQRHRRTDRWTDEHHGNSATIRSMNATRAKNHPVIDILSANLTHYVYVHYCYLYACVHCCTLTAILKQLK